MFERLADITPRRLIKAVGKAYPDASKKEIVRAAFHGLITTADRHTEKIQLLQSFAIEPRSSDDEFR